MLRRLFIVFILISTFAVAGCKISGTITLDEVGLEGVTVVLDGDASVSTTTDADGTYVFEGFHHGTFTITPESEGYTFEPLFIEMTVDFFENVVEDFVATKLSSSKQSSEKPPEPWSTYQGNAAHTGYVPVFLNTNEFSEGWTRDIIGSAALNPVAAGDGKVFVTTLGYFGPNVAMALDSDTGDELWVYHFGNIHSIQPPAYANGTVYIQSTNHQNDSFIWAFDAESGDMIFKTAYENQWDRYYAPTIYDDNVYIGGGYYSGAYGIDGISGEELWYVDWGNQYMQWTPAVNEEQVIAYTGLYIPQLTVINRLTGEVEFSILDPNFVWDGWSMNLAPVLGNQNNVIAIHDGRLISFDLDPDLPGIGWEIPKKGEDVEGFSGQPSLAKGIIYAVYDGYLHALNEGDGLFIEEWKPWQPLDGEIIVSPMIVTDNLIFVSTEFTTYAVDLESQTQQWSYPAGGHLALGNDGILFIATSEGNLIAISTIAIEEF